MYKCYPRSSDCIQIQLFHYSLLVGCNLNINKHKILLIFSILVEIFDFVFNLNGDNKIILQTMNKQLKLIFYLTICFSPIISKYFLAVWNNLGSMGTIKYI